VKTCFSHLESYNWSLKILCLWFYLGSVDKLFKKSLFHYWWVFSF